MAFTLLPEDNIGSVRHDLQWEDVTKCRGEAWKRSGVGVTWTEEVKSRQDAEIGRDDVLPLEQHANHKKKQKTDIYNNVSTP
jgi:hypothetical protein